MYFYHYILLFFQSYIIFNSKRYSKRHFFGDCQRNDCHFGRDYSNRIYSRIQKLAVSSTVLRNGQRKQLQLLNKSKHFSWILLKLRMYCLFEIYNPKMANYDSLPLSAWEKYAHEVCTAIDIKIKQQAQQFFYLFVQSPSLQLIVNLIQQGSDLLVFAIFSYINKHPLALLRDCQCFEVLMQVIGAWQLQQSTFVRPGLRPFQSFVTKTIMMCLGNLMKLLYQSSETSNTLVKIIEDMPLNFFKILTLKTFVEAVEIVDSEMGYMRFRTMIYAFQDNVIPMICECLMPFFYAFEQGLKINELSMMQSRLGVNQQQQTTQTLKPSQLPLSRQQQMHSEYVLMLLKKIVEFNYNITYTEYESEQVIDTCLITFPDKVLEKIINHEFLNSLFYVIEKVMESKVGERKNEYLTIVLECLAKIMQARLGYVTDQHKEMFLRAAVKGLTHLLQICQQLQSQILLEGILVCNKKLLMGSQLNFIKRAIESDQNLRQNDLFKVYIRDLSWMLLHIFKKSYIHTDNNLLIEALEVTSKMVSHLGYSRDTESIDDSSQFYVSLIRDIVVSYVNSLCHPRYIFSTVRVVWVSENKQSVSHLFQQFKKLSSFVYLDLFNALDYCLEKYANEHRSQLSIFANLLFLLSQLVDRHFLQRNVHFNKAKDSDIALLAMIVKKASMLVQQYAANRINYVQTKDTQYLDIAVLIFTESLLMEFLSSFQTNVTIKIKQKLYLLMIFGDQYSQDLQQQENQSEQTIAVYLTIIFHFLNNEVVCPDSDVKMLYALQVVEKVIFKLKWNMRRECFLKCQIFKQLLAFFEDYFNRCPPVPEIMAKVGKITVSLNFDDILDQYKFRINNFINKLPKKDSVRSVFYYLMGIFEGIEPGNICRYFCYQLKRELNLSNFFSEIFKMAVEANTDKDYKDVCRFCKLIVLNKGLKHSSNSFLVYELLGLILPHLIWFINTINNSQQLNVDLVGDAISELIELFCGIVNGTHVNIFVLDESSIGQSNQSQPLGQQYVSQFLRMQILLCRQLKLYPKLQQSSLHCFLSINKQILEYIYDRQDKTLPDIYNHLMMTQIDIAVQYISSQLNGNRLVEDKLLKIIDSLRIFYQYINRKSHILHKHQVLSHLKRYCEMSQHFINQTSTQNKLEKLTFYIISLILTNHKNNISYIRSISKLIYEINKRYRVYIVETFKKLHISTLKLREVESILESFSEDIEENFIEHFKVWVKEFNQFK